MPSIGEASSICPATFSWRAAGSFPSRILERLIEAYAIYRERAGSLAWQLVLVGDGPSRKPLEARIRALNLEDSVQIRGFCQYDELPIYYALAGALVHVSTVEPWGLVINEALASRLPVIVSRTCGAVEDLVSDGKNGFVVDPYDAGQIAAALETLSSMSPADRSRMGEIGFARITDWGPARFAEGLRKAIDVAYRKPVTPVRPHKRALLAAISYFTWRRDAQMRQAARLN